MKKGAIWALVVVAAILVYIIVFAEGKTYDPNVMKYQDTASMSNRINLREKYTDTVSMSNRVNSKLATADTINKWWPRTTTFPDSVVFYNTAGRVNQRLKVWSDVVTPSTANGYSVDISSAGFATVLYANAMPIRNTATTTSVPNCAVKSITTTAVVFNIVEGNSSLVSLLGSGVLLGVSNQFANTTGLTLYVQVYGY
jgi:hypothetical protein